MEDCYKINHNKSDKIEQTGYSPLSYKKQYTKEKIFLNTTGILDDVDEEMLEFLAYIENTTEQFANRAKSNLVKQIHQKVNEVRHDYRMEAEYMTLLERDRENKEIGRAEGRAEGVKQTAKNLLMIGVNIEQIIQATGLSKEEIEQLRD